MYTWRMNWINNYDSAWCILEKFKYANSISNKELYSLLGISSQFESTIVNHQKVSEKSLVTLAGFNSDKLIKTLGFDLKKYNKQKINSITHTLNKQYGIDKNIKKSLSICPYCIKEGYHSYWNQITFFDKCSKHNTYLLDYCPKCHRRNEYNFVSNSRLAFRCSFCNYSYIDDNANKLFFNTWGQNEEILSKEQQLLLDLNKQIQGLNAYASYYSSLENKENEGISKMQILDNFINSCSLHNIKRTPTSERSKNLLRSRSHGNLVLDLDKELYESYVSIFKTIARQIRKNDKHIKYAVQEIKKRMITLNCNNQVFSNLFPNNNNFLNKIYPPGYAYLMWRRDIQGFDSWDRVYTNVLSYKPRFEFPNLYTDIIQSDFFRYFKKEFILYLENDIPSCKMDYFCIIEHMMAYMFVRHYQNWFKTAYQDYKNQTISMQKKIPYEMPVFIVKFPAHKNKKSGDIEFSHLPYLNISSR